MIAKIALSTPELVRPPVKTEILIVDVSTNTAMIMMDSIM
jgi:hypothetical protein